MGGVLDIMHGLSPRIMSPSHPFNAWTEDVGVSSRPCRQLLAPNSRRHVRYWARTHATIGRYPVFIFRGFLFEELFINEAYYFFEVPHSTIV